MRRSTLAIVTSAFLLILLLLALCIPASIKLENDMWLAIAVVGAGLIVIALCIILTHESGVSWISSPGHIRATIAVSIVTEYMVLVGVVAFFHGWSDATTPAVTQTLVTKKAKEARSQKAKSEDRDDPQN
jgi:hypothetical protein